MEFYPVNKPDITFEDIEQVTESLRKKYISGEGEFVEAFETNFSNYIGKRYGVAVSSGSTALEVAFNSLDLKPGDEVILPSFAIISCLAPILRLKLTPIFIDSDPQNWNMCISETISKITVKTKVILVVHTYGLCVDLMPIVEACNKNDIILVEDAAEVHGAKYLDRKAGSYGHVSTFSFYANKIITTGEGGMILTDNSEIYGNARSLRNLAFIPEKRFIHDKLGFNFRLSSLQAALGISQLKNIDFYLLKRRKIYEIYFEILEGLNFISFQPSESHNTSNVYWVIGLLLNPEFKHKKTELVSALTANNIQTRPFFYPLDRQPVLRDYGIEINHKPSFAMQLYESGLYLPSGNGYTEKEIISIALKTKDVMNDLFK